LRPAVLHLNFGETEVEDFLELALDKLRHLAEMGRNVLRPYEQKP
jgi:hypothetical protein